jgi:hypothetical protein
MPTVKLSQITPAPPSTANDKIVGVIGGTTDALYTVAQVLSFFGSAQLDTFGSAQGDILYRNILNWTALPPGLAGQFLRTGGAGANPQWVSVIPGSGAPGGAINEFQYNAGGGSFGGASNVTWNASPTVSGAGPGQIATFINPAAHNDPTDMQGFNINFIYDGAVGSPGFTERGGYDLGISAAFGQNTNDAVNDSKWTFNLFNMFANYHAAGQKNLATMSICSYGMGDTSIGQNSVDFWGGPVSGDEGQGWALVSRLGQGGTTAFNPDGFHLARHQIGTVTQSTIAAGITVTQPIVGSSVVQTVTVSSTVGINPTDWLAVNQAVPAGSDDMEAVQVTAVGVGTISGIFQNNQLIGATLGAALVLTEINGFWNGCGQGRFLVNETKAAYTTGTVSSISGGGFVGLGTGWSVGMVGGNTVNVGAICLAADYYTGVPFDNTVGSSGSLNCSGCDSWYLITTPLNATALGILSFSVAGDRAYYGRGPGAGAYTIRQSARILRCLVTGTQPVPTTLICEPSTSTWSANDIVLCPVCPYPDVTGHQEFVIVYTPGGIRRAWYNVTNDGARAFQTGLNFTNQMVHGIATGGGTINSDYPVAWQNGISIDSCITGLFIDTVAAGSIPSIFPQQPAAIAFGQTSTGRIAWGTQNSFPYWENNATNMGLSGRLAGSPNASGVLNAISTSMGPNTDASLAELQWVGWLKITGSSSVHPPYIQFDGAGSAAITIQALIGAGGLNGRHFGIDFAVNDGSDPIFIPLSLGGPAISPNNNVAINQLGTSLSNVTNQGSTELDFITSVWTGAVAASRPAIITAVPASGLNNAPLTYKVQFLDSRIAYNTSFPIDVWSVTEAGVMFLGQNNIGNGAPILGINMDASSNPTAIRTVKWPDVAGDILVASANMTGGGTPAFTGANNSPAVTPGTVYTWLQLKSNDGSTVYVPAWK